MCADMCRGLFTDLREQERRSAAQKAAELEAEHYVAEKWEKQRYGSGAIQLQDHQQHC